MKRNGHFGHRRSFTMWERTSHAPSRARAPRADEPACNPFAARLREMLQSRQKTIYQLSAITGIDGSYLWRIVRGERVEISREVVIKIGLALAQERPQYDLAIKILNPLLDGASHKILWER